MPRPRTPRTLRSLRHRNFRLLVQGALVSSSGDFMQNVAQSWLVWNLSHSPFAIGLVAVFDAAPRLLVGAWGGAIADRFDRRRVLMITQTAAMIQAIVYWLAVEFDVIALWHIAALAFCLGVINTINQIARQSLIHSLVPAEELLNAIALQSFVVNFSKILGPSAGGLIIAYLGVAGCFLVNAISFVFLLFNLYLMELPPWQRRAEEPGLWNDVKEGFQYLVGDRRLLSIVGVSYVVATLCAPYNRFVPIVATNILHVGASGFGVLMAAPGAGATLAALTLASARTFHVGLRAVCSAAVAFAVFLVLLALSRDFVFSFCLLAMIGFAQIAARSLANAAIQTATPSNLVGRILSLFFMDRGLWSVGSVIMGTAAAAIGIQWTFALCGSVSAIVAASLLAVSRSRRRQEGGGRA